MSHFLHNINWQTAVLSGALLLTLWTFLRQGNQEREKRKLDLLAPRFEVHTRTLRFIQALYESPQYVRSPAFSEIHKDFIMSMKRSKMLFNPAVADLLAQINLEAFKIKAAKEVDRTMEPLIVKTMFDDQMKALAAIEDTFPKVESAMAPYLSFGNIAT
jgi:hypothetical protein